jgi:DNA-binding transcriptional MerR regulator
MRISELSERTGVPIATIKYYLREGLLMAGESTGATRAEYDGQHVERVRLVRALVEVGGLSLAATAAVLAAVNDPAERPIDVIGRAHAALPSPAPDADQTRVDALLARLGWDVCDTNPGRTALAAALEAVDSAGIEVPDDELDRYAFACEDVARVDLDAVLRQRDRSAVLRTVVVGTVLVDAVLSALRRLAQEHVTVGRLGA